ncbi:MAG: hypothetical protein LUH14_01040 [Clostridiaceae bacterium]|nr:hypothetical protein [Clostridiaceae bacterium]
MKKHRSVIRQISLEFELLMAHTRSWVEEPGSIEEKRTKILSETKNTVAKASLISNVSHTGQVSETLFHAVTGSEVYRNGIVYKEKNGEVEAALFAGFFAILLGGVFFALHFLLGVPVSWLISVELFVTVAAWYFACLKLVPKIEIVEFYNAAAEFIHGIKQEAVKWEHERVEKEYPSTPERERLRDSMEDFLSEKISLKGNWDEYEKTITELEEMGIIEDVNDPLSELAEEFIEIQNDKYYNS